MVGLLLPRDGSLTAAGNYAMPGRRADRIAQVARSAEDGPTCYKGVDVPIRSIWGSAEQL